MFQHLGKLSFDNLPGRGKRHLRNEKNLRGPFILREMLRGIFCESAAVTAAFGRS